MFDAPETLPRHTLERSLRRARLLNLVLGGFAVLGLAFGAVQCSTAGNGGAVAAGAESEEMAGASIERRIVDDPMAIGAVDAPIVLSEWVDLRCPYCAVYSRDTLPQLIEEYVDRGEVRIEMHDVAFFGEESVRAAAAARAAGEQGRYFEFVQAVFAAAPESGHPELPVAELRAFAELAGVTDLERFEADMQSEELIAAVDESTALAQRLGVTGVPFFAVGQEALSGAQPIETFRQFIDQQLAAE